MPPLLKQSSLQFRREAQPVLPAGRQEPRQELRPRQLWLCLQFSRLPLEALAGQPGFSGLQERPLAIWTAEGRHGLVVTANALACALGVRAGMPVNSALVLAPQLVLEERQPALEAAALSRLADWAGRYTSAVSRMTDDALLLEIHGSLRLFNGLQALQRQVDHGLRARGHEARMGCAPTARAALWLARAGVKAPARTPEELRQLMAGIAVSHLGWPVRTVRMLSQMGLATVGDCLRLPRDGFARRFGAVRLQELDQAMGRQPEPYRAHEPLARFSAGIELPAETADASLLLEGIQHLLAELGRELEVRQAGVCRVWCRLAHADGIETRFCIGLHQAAGRTGHLQKLFRLRLEKLVLPGPVTGLRLQAELEAGQAPAGTDLLGTELQPDEGLRALLDRLRARLGDRAVQGLALRAEHRPEHAWRRVADPLRVTAAGSRLPARCRPVWLLPRPQRLTLVDGRPEWRGPLCLEQGPERIESGWWDGGDVRRDYYRASNPQGAVLWVYQDLRSRDWFLQGVFG